MTTAAAPTPTARRTALRSPTRRTRRSSSSSRRRRATRSARSRRASCARATSPRRTRCRSARCAPTPTGARAAHSERLGRRAPALRQGLPRRAALRRRRGALAGVAARARRGAVGGRRGATTAADDEALMEALPERKGRAWAALATRHGEKRLLRDALEELGRARVAVRDNISRDLTPLGGGRRLKLLARAPWLRAVVTSCRSSEGGCRLAHDGRGGALHPTANLRRAARSLYGLGSPGIGVETPTKLVALLLERTSVSPSLPLPNTVGVTVRASLNSRRSRPRYPSPREQLRFWRRTSRDATLGRSHRRALAVGQALPRAAKIARTTTHVPNGCTKLRAREPTRPSARGRPLAADRAARRASIPVRERRRAAAVGDGDAAARLRAALRRGERAFFFVDHAKRATTWQDPRNDPPDVAISNERRRRRCGSSSS